jgi:hypothetical protein
MEERLIGHVGDPRIHDAVVETVRESPGAVAVVVRTEAGEALTVSFAGVHSVKSHRPVGMMLYALSELESCGPGRHFQFANWDEDDDASLEIQAESMSVANGDNIAA